MTTELNWHLRCDQRTFEACRANPKFPYIVALARAVNALNFVHSAMIHAGEGDAPEASRDRINSYFFASAILYEGMNLIRVMNQTFKDDDMFQNGLRPFLRDKVAQTITETHLNPARNGVVFHFLPERFAETIRSASCDNCIFVSGRGDKKKDLYYDFADVVAAEILVGYASDSEEFYEALWSSNGGHERFGYSLCACRRIINFAPP
jgi:hypothetical protein